MDYHEIFWDMTLALAKLGVRHGEADFQGVWANKKPWNTPGPFYTGDVDNSGPGPAEAPNNVYVDECGFPFVFRQPTSQVQLDHILDAAYSDPFAGYALDGNQHWTYGRVREWWQGRQEMEAFITATRNKMLHGLQPPSPWYWAPIERWSTYLQTDMEGYLRVYTFFLEEGRVPEARDVLPNV